MRRPIGTTTPPRGNGARTPVTEPISEDAFTLTLHRGIRATTGIHELSSERPSNAVEG
ncbi:hypothetical protein GZH49_36395 [Nocardia terpenica]|uniref:hypothetical protein n=1 Tax=Nocardia terpenica TaxID=455432 RepID=UPI002FE1FB65